MVTFVEVNFGTEYSYPPPPSTNMGCIIGKSTVIPSTNPFRIGNITDLTDKSIPSTSQLYKACSDFLTAANGSNASIWAYALTEGGSSKDDESLLGLINGTNKTFYAPFAPIVSATGIEINYDGSGWIVQSGTYWTTGVTNGIKDGRIIFGESGFHYSGYDSNGSLRDMSGYILTGSRGDAIRGDFVVDGISNAFDSLKENAYDFNMFCFAYDNSIACGLDPNQASAFKFATGQCYSASGWLQDIYIGKTLSQQFNSVGKGCIYYFCLPESVRENTKMSGYAGNTTYSGYAYSDLPTILGNTYYIAGFASKQGVAGGNMDAIAMGMSLKQEPRTPMMYTPLASNVIQTTYPSKNEILAWRSAKINPVMDITRGVDHYYCLGGNNTFGIGREKDINYVRCRDLLKKKLIMNLQTLLISRTLKYDMNGINNIKLMIMATEKDCLEKGWIDGLGIVTIPIESYLRQESSLDAGQKIVLESARQNKSVDNITVTWQWKGDIEEIIIRSLAVE